MQSKPGYSSIFKLPVNDNVPKVSLPTSGDEMIESEKQVEKTAEKAVNTAPLTETKEEIKVKTPIIDTT